MRAVALLRGVNVGRVRFAMTDLAAALAASGFTEVRTVLASGNVVLTSDLDEPNAIADAVSAVIRERFGFDVAAIVVSLPGVRRAVEEYPFPRQDDRHAYVVFADEDAALADLVSSSAELDDAEERVKPGEGVVYWDVLKGRTLDSAFGKRFGRWQKAGTVTTRSIRTHACHTQLSPESRPCPPKTPCVPTTPLRDQQCLTLYPLTDQEKACHCRRRYVPWSSFRVLCLILCPRCLRQNVLAVFLCAR